MSLAFPYFRLMLALFAMAAPSMSRAQCRLCPNPTTAADPTTVETPLRLEIVSTIDFDRLIFAGVGSGSAVLGPDGTRYAAGAIGAVSSRAVVAEVVIRGEPGRTVRVDLPTSIEMRGLKGGALSVTAIRSDLPDSPALDRGGELRIRIGGELRVSGDVDGDFRGDIPIIVDYL